MNRADITPDFFREHSTVDQNGCWNWAGGRASTGYGAITVDGRQRKAHRLSYEAHTGEQIPPGMFACHRCDNRLCIRPDHIFIGTSADNTRDMQIKGRARFFGTAITETTASQIREDVRRWKMIAKDYGINRWAIWRIKTHRTFWPPLRIHVGQHLASKGEKP